MKIVHVISSIDPAKGGPQAAVARIAAAQCMLGHDVHVISYAGTTVQEKAFRTAAGIPEFEKIRWHLLPDADRLERVTCIKGAKLISKVLRFADFVHLHGIWEPILLRSASKARVAGIPYCVTPHGMLDVWSLRQKAWKKRLALSLGYRRMLCDAKFIHALNSDEAQLMRPLGLKVPMVVIPNGVFPQEFEQRGSEAPFREQIGMPADRRFVLFLSRLHFKKGLDLLAHAFQSVASRCPEVDLVVAGPDDGAQDGFLAIIRDLGIEHRVRLTGPLYGTSKQQALFAAACFCLPSRQEGFSLAITEALACGAPVVISDACHFPEVDAAEAGFVTPLAPAAIADALVTVLENDRLARKMGENGHRLVVENFTWPVIAGKTISSYRLYA